MLFTLGVHTLLAAMITEFDGQNIYGPTIATAITSFLNLFIITVQCYWYSDVSFLPENFKSLMKSNDVWLMSKIALPPTIFLQNIWILQAAFVYLFSDQADETTYSTNLVMTNYLFVVMSIVIGF